MDKEQLDPDVAPGTPSGGGWYWIDRDVLKHHAPSIGALGVAVYNVLASAADNRRECFPSQELIAKTLGYSRASVNKVVKVLKKEGLIEVKKRNAYHCFYRLVSRRCKAEETEMSTEGNRDVRGVDTNDNQLTRINNDTIVGVKKEYILPGVDRNTEFKPGTREELLAFDIATATHDFDNLPRYLSLAKKHQESLLRQILSEAREIPDARIRTSRAALFNHLLKKHVQEVPHHPLR